MAERAVWKDKGISISPKTKSESTVTAPSPPYRPPNNDHLYAGHSDLKRRGSELSKLPVGFADTNESINQLIPPVGCTPPTAADILKSKGNYPTKEVDSCKPVEYATTVSHSHSQKSEEPKAKD
ncbi:hypothetical protein ElyMa_006550400 [Elysia marginata]|uniref:Zasp-like motif domain-containing protein n=1 Tax=Elysia marginata TaxID=1093978 RepID=A0AAV4I9B7_9GAST|nr:hypothetical protein ElyMa_006550400 [Elysia marginata]